jgi:hypothetical protein
MDHKAGHITLRWECERKERLRWEGTRSMLLVLFAVSPGGLLHTLLLRDEHQR